MSVAAVVLLWFFIGFGLGAAIRNFRRFEDVS